LISNSRSIAFSRSRSNTFGGATAYEPGRKLFSVVCALLPACTLITRWLPPTDSESD